MALDEKKVALLKAAAEVTKGIFDQIKDAEASEIEAEYATQLAAQKDAPVQSPLDLTEKALDLAVAIADEIGNPKVTLVVSDIRDTADDAIAGKFGAVIGDLIKDYKDIKSLKKG
jgi:hypothetical protein